ncbi:hypothetical protein QQS21_009649 [Conoideocrella luteorostrata]|uniref:ATP-grasp domain-containing protein n=1 Tax=Conoideocrella luteorostrata TaxID=1105319 RepID=A0AAJ0FXL5_9HYPO|nr:hypothetical protein QQS21_009649 [Conoideocrella luteorostrata]
MRSAQELQVLSKKDDSILLEASWGILNATQTRESWQSLSIQFNCKNSSLDATLLGEKDSIYLVKIVNGSMEVAEPDSFGSPKQFQFLLQCLQMTATIKADQSLLVTLIVPLQEGYIVRSDIIPLRLRDSEYFEVAVSFAEPLQQYPGREQSLDDRADIATSFSAAAAGLILRRIPGSILSNRETTLSISVESDLDNRLSLPWITPGTPTAKTLVLVDANSSHPEDGLGLYMAAKALGINVVVLENSGSWLEKEEHAHWRDAFIPTRLTNPPQADVGDHIVKSVLAYGKPVDGIVTFADSFWPYIAEIAPQLGLKTASPQAFKTATNKYLTSKFVGHNAYNGFSLDDALGIVSQHQLQYPLVIKPCDGWSSEGVSRIDSVEYLTDAVRAIDSSRHGTEFVIEEYCEGPEVDINFILLDGEILFFEVCDDFPKSADINGQSVGSLTNFHELNSVYPSILPHQEIELLRDSFLDTLLKLGIKDGIMHLEGRVQDSTVEYKMKNGVVDLVAAEDQSKEPKAWLIEINPRPLGMTGSYVVESTHGIDYWGVALALAVGDKERVRVLSQPFKAGPQYTCVMVFIPVDYPISSQGIFDSDDVCADLKERRPDLAKQISRSACLIKKGQQVPHPSTGRNTFLAYFNVFSREGRQRALELANEVRAEVRYSFI